MARILLCDGVMILKFRKLSVMAIFLILLMLVPQTVFCAGNAPARGVSIAVVPVIDGDSDEKSRETAKMIASSLSHVTQNHIVDSNLTARILDYYNDSAQIKTPSLGEADRILADAKEKFFKFHYEEAESELGRAISLLESKRGEMSKAGPKLVDAYVSRAVIAKSRGDIKKTKEALEAALKINPKLDLRAEEYPPSLVSLFEEERKNLAQNPAGSITVSTEPQAAEIFLNGISLGVSPLEISALPAGVYSISIRTNKYDPIEKTVTVASGATVNIREKIRYADKKTETKSYAQKDSHTLINEGLRIADIMKTDKVVLVDTDIENGREKIVARMVDRNLRAGQRPIAVKIGDRGETEALITITKSLAQEAIADLSDDPVRRLDPVGMADPVLLGKHKDKKELHKSPIFWGVLGTLVAGALGGGLAAAFSGGGGGGGGGVGSVSVNFKRK